MKHIVVTSEAQATRLASDTDALLGMPWQPTSFIGAGPHVFQATEHYDRPRKHPTENRWALSSAGLEDEDDGHGGKRLTLPPGAQVRELAADWTVDPGPPAIVARVVEQQIRS